MRTVLIISIIGWCSFAPLAGATDVPAGDVFGQWTPLGSPYRILGDITVPAGQQLTLLPGVDVIFQGDYRLTALGTIQANGSAVNPVQFRALSGNWAGVRLENTMQLSQFHYCRIEDAAIAINSVNSPVRIENCEFWDNTKAIHVFGVGNATPPPVTIRHCHIENCQQNGIFIVENSNTLIDSCEITQCALDQAPRGAIQISNQSPNGSCNPTIRGSHIHHNVWQGITAFDVTGQGNIAPLVEGNRIEYNYTGVYLLYASGEFRENQIQHNFQAGNPNSGAGVMVGGNTSEPLFVRNVITGNFTGFYFVNGASANLGDLVNDYPGDDGENHIFGNVDPDGDVWSVYNDSVADIMAENNRWDSEDFEEIALTIFDHNDDASKGTVDFDPIFDGGVGVEPVQVTTTPQVTQLLGNYPNPFNPRTTIHFQISEADAGQPVQLRLYDVQGRLQKTLLDHQSFGAGQYQLSVEASDLPSGTYLYRFVCGQTQISRMMTVLK
ncbi:MAG: T9SS C-terminal target domain-containing protein [Gemmatimonadetes bacterium]|nr:MAG: T9SS C-terminal target domain-containing protein [Gemmatimonadota bacterium]